ncbi:MAG TPA: TonB-dependent receptor plug domain-containing protein, partial [Sphingomicrobium sp.]|nr:TonB-dependent receptor plug domain-containing protein [Sphingomicrobium sp.]
MAAPPQHFFSIPSGSLDRAISLIATQAGVDIGGTVSGFSKVKTKGVSGRMSTAKALARLLAETGYEAIAAGPSAFRIVKRTSPPPTPPKNQVRLSDTVAAARPGTFPSEPIIVNANKHASSRLRFAGSVQTAFPGLWGAGDRNASDGISDLARALPILQSTDLGSGRNKVFIRGIADSSFDGPTQATAAIYFDDVPVGYNGPDPNLSLYDVGTVEILEGPQGTLYGAGAIGGIIRLSPNPPDLSRMAGRLSLGTTITQNGDLGHDEAGMVNVPIIKDRLGLRAVGYHVDSGGYVDDTLRHLTDINRTKTLGGRLDISARPATGWAVDGGIVYQTISAPDSQYALHGSHGLSRASRFAQPFEDDFALARLV